MSGTSVMQSTLGPVKLAALESYIAVLRVITCLKQGSLTSYCISVFCECEILTITRSII